MAVYVTVATLRKLWPHADEAKPGLCAAVAAASPFIFAKYGLTSTLVVAHAMAQFSHEFGADMPAKSMEFEENLSYSALRMTQVWPSRFPTIESAEPYARNPKALANKVYNGRMGNRVGTDDGYNFRGRGASQVTGREGYTKLAVKTGLPLLDHPEMVNEPDHFLECAVADFILCGCLPYAEKDDVVGVTKKLNGGTVGLSERKQWLAKWKKVLAAQGMDNPPVIAPVAPKSAPVPPPAPVTPKVTAAPQPAPKPAPAPVVKVSSAPRAPSQLLWEGVKFIVRKLNGYK